MTRNLYDIGDLVRCTGTFASSGTNVNPSAVMFKVRTPAGVVTTYTYGVDAALVRDATGVYHVDVSADTAGDWLYRFWSTGTGQAAEEGRFRVQSSLFSS
jgi:hypothetical protein